MAGEVVVDATPDSGGSWRWLIPVIMVVVVVVVKEEVFGDGEEGGIVEDKDSR